MGLNKCLYQNKDKIFPTLLLFWIELKPPKYEEHHINGYFRRNW